MKRKVQHDHGKRLENFTENVLLSMKIHYQNHQEKPELIKESLEVKNCIHTEGSNHREKRSGTPGKLLFCM